MSGISLKNLDMWAVADQNVTGWKDFKVPTGELIDCFKARDLVEDAGPHPETQRNWGTNIRQSSLLNPARVNSQGVGQGTPMQLGRVEMRPVTWGSGYGRVQQLRTQIPRPLFGNRYWITGYPTHSFDRRCIIMGPDKTVYELIQFDQDAPIRPAGFPQQALNRGTWKDGELVDGLATTAADLPSHAHIWGRGSIENPHCQCFTVQDYLEGDGTEGFAAAFPDGPVCGDWFYLPDDSPSYVAMVAKGGQCAARAQAMNIYGAKLIDRGNRTSVLTQAGTWARNTNIHQFTISLNDLRLV